MYAAFIVSHAALSSHCTPRALSSLATSQGILHEERHVGSPAPSGVDDEAAPAVTSGKGGLRPVHDFERCARERMPQISVHVRGAPSTRGKPAAVPQRAAWPARLARCTGRRPSLGTASVPREYSEPRLGACSEARCLESAPPRLGRGPLPSLGGCQWSPRRHRASVPRLGGGLGLLLGSWREPVPRETSDDKGFLCFVSKSRDGAISGMYLMLSVHQKIYTSKRK